MRFFAAGPSVCGYAVYQPGDAVLSVALVQGRMAERADTVRQSGHASVRGLHSCIYVRAVRAGVAGNQWSEAAAMLGYSGAGKTLFVPASVKTMETTSPYACMAQIFLLMLGYTLVLVCVMLAFNVWKGTIAGMLGALGYSLAGLLLTPRAFIQLFALPEELYYRAVLIAGWVSPLNQATYQMHNFGYDDLPTLSQTYLVFSVAALLLCAVSLRLMRRYSFTFTGARS